MTKTAQINEYAAQLNVRYDAEKINNKSATSLAFITKCSLVCSQESVFNLLKKCEVAADFALDSKQANSQFCMKSLENFAHMLEFAVSRRNVDDLKSNVEECLRTVLLFKQNNEEITLNDLKIVLDNTVKVSKDRAHLYYRRKAAFSSAARHASMNMRALVALNVVKAVSKDKYKVNDNDIVSMIAARFAA